MKILVIGSVNIDLVMKTGRIPKQGETIYGESFSTVCGGKGANQAVAAAKMGSEVRMICSVGSDFFGKALIDNLKVNGIGTEGVNVTEGSSGIAFITVCKGDNSIILEPGANAMTTPALIDSNISLFEWADMIIMQFEIPYETIVYAAQTAKRLGKNVLLNPAPFREIKKELAECVDILIPNEHEAAGLLGYEVGAENAKKAVRDLNAMGFGQVIITLGKYGCAYNSDREIKRFGIYETEVKDTTAAGDSFIAGLCSALGDGNDIDSAVSFASAVSAIVVTRIGAGSSLPSRKEVERFLEDADSKYIEI